MGRISKWLFGVLTAALGPLLDVFDRRFLDIEAATSQGHGATRDALGNVREALVLLDDHATMRGADNEAALNELIGAVRGQTEAMRAWEDALLGRVAGLIAEGQADVHATLNRIALTAHAEALLSGLVTAEQRAVIEAAVANIAQDTRLAEQRPDLRAQLSIGDSLVRIPEVPHRIADLVRALAYCRTRGDC